MAQGNLTWFRGQEVNLKDRKREREKGAPSDFAPGKNQRNVRSSRRKEEEKAKRGEREAFPAASGGGLETLENKLLI